MLTLWCNILNTEIVLDYIIYILINNYIIYQQMHAMQSYNF